MMNIYELDQQFLFYTYENWIFINKRLLSKLFFFFVYYCLS